MKTKTEIKSAVKTVIQNPDVSIIEDYNNVKKTIFKEEKNLLKVLITGASSGIGLATAEYLASKGYLVIGTTRSLKENEAKILEHQHKFKGFLRFVEMDVTQEESVNQCIMNVLKETDGIDILICNAGFGIFGSIEETPLESVQKLFDVNYLGYLRTIQAVVPSMREKKAGKILLVSSIAGLVSIPFQTHYSATKYAIEALTEGLCQELRTYGITVSAVRPGDIHTRFNEATLKHIPSNSPYKELCDKSWKTIDKNMQVAPKPILVAKIISRIIRKRRANTYYTAADFFTSLVPLLNRLFSSKMKEKLMRIYYGIDRREKY